MFPNILSNSFRKRINVLTKAHIWIQYLRPLKKRHTIKAIRIYIYIWQLQDLQKFCMSRSETHFVEQNISQSPFETHDRVRTPPYPSVMMTSWSPLRVPGASRRSTRYAESRGRLGLGSCSLQRSPREDHPCSTWRGWHTCRHRPWRTTKERGGKEQGSWCRWGAWTRGRCSFCSRIKKRTNIPNKKQ